MTYKELGDIFSKEKYQLKLGNEVYFTKENINMFTLNEIMDMADNFEISLDDYELEPVEEEYAKSEEEERLSTKPLGGKHEQRRK